MEREFLWLLLRSFIVSAVKIHGMKHWRIMENRVRDVMAGFMVLVLDVIQINSMELVIFVTVYVMQWSVMVVTTVLAGVIVVGWGTVGTAGTVIAKMYNKKEN